MNEVAKTQNTEPTTADTVKVWLAVAIALAGIVAFYLLKGHELPWLRWLAMFGGFALALVVFAVSQQGRNFWSFALDSRIELRKVFWPTRQETGMTTLVVFGFVAVASIFFYILDLILAWVTRAFTGQGA
jgi:preprotein translocase subunit SecE